MTIERILRFQKIRANWLNHWLNKMQQLLKKLKLVQSFSTKIEMQKSEFVNKFRQHVDEGDTGPFSDVFDAFSSSKNEYKGHVGFNEFKIKRRKKFFDMNMSLAVAKGTYRQQENSLIIEAEINGFRGQMIPFLIIAIFIYTIAIVAILFSNTEGSGAGFAIPFILIHACFMFGFPYLLMRRSVSKMHHELEREFYFMTKEQ
jgi:hypothetical protein